MKAGADETADPSAPDDKLSDKATADATTTPESAVATAEPGTPAAPAAATALAMMQMQAGTAMADEAGAGSEAAAAVAAGTTGAAPAEADAAAQAAIAAEQGISGKENGTETGAFAGAVSSSGAAQQGATSHGAALSELATALAADGAGAQPSQGQPGAMSQDGRTIAAEAKQQGIQASEAAKPDLKAGDVPAVDGAKIERAETGAGQPATKASEPPGPSLLQTGAAHAPARASEAMPPAPPEMPRAVAPGAVPVEIGLRALQGLKEFQIRLDPAELGRVEVKLEIGEDNLVTARVVVDRVETLHLLQRDARTLERAFEQAGLKSSDGGIDFSLRDQGQGARQDGGGQDRDRPGRAAGTDRADAPELTPLPLRRMLHVGALDLSI